MKVKVNSIKESSERIDIDVDVVLPGTIKEVDIEFDWHEVDPFEGKTVCVKCLNYGGRVDVYSKCNIEKEIININYISGTSDKFNINSLCYDKNEDGDCKDFVPSDPYKRMDILLEEGRKRLERELRIVMDGIKEKVRRKSCFELMAEAGIKGSKAGNDFARALLGYQHKNRR